LTVHLTALGVHARLEAHDRQLVVVPLNAVPDLADPVLRAAVVDLARSAGFSHVSLEIPGDEDDATLHRDQPS
jgi:hypothetical protein